MNVDSTFFPAGRHLQRQLQAVCMWRICLFGKRGAVVLERWSDAGEMKERSWAWAEESSRPEKNPDTLLHIKERASDTIISLGCESPTLLIKTRLLNHPSHLSFPSLLILSLIFCGGTDYERKEKRGRVWENTFEVSSGWTQTIPAWAATSSCCIRSHIQTTTGVHLATVEPNVKY